MAGTKINAKKIALAYKEAVASKLKVDSVFMFGSAARGSATTASDIDLIVLSRDFTYMPFMKRLQLLNRLRRGSALQVAMDIIGFTPKEFTALKRDESPNARKVYQEAKRIYP